MKWVLIGARLYPLSKCTIISHLYCQICKQVSPKHGIKNQPGNIITLIGWAEFGPLVTSRDNGASRFGRKLIGCLF